MAIEALLSGALLILSNCWARTEIASLLEKYKLDDRLIILNDINPITFDFAVQKLTRQSKMVDQRELWSNPGLLRAGIEEKRTVANVKILEFIYG